jgi:hypothetical protein
VNFQTDAEQSSGELTSEGAFLACFAPDLHLQLTYKHVYVQSTFTTQKNRAPPEGIDTTVTKLALIKKDIELFLLGAVH